jgi:uncharacterized protein with gpF-like domain
MEQRFTRTTNRAEQSAMNLSYEDLQNIRDALNEKIHRIVMDGTKAGTPIGGAATLAETRDKIQDEMDRRKGPN